MSDTVVIGIGNPYRRDDGVGPAAAAAVKKLLPTAQVEILDGEPTRLLDAWAGCRLAVVVDAIRAGDPPGTVHRIEVGVDPLPRATARASTHAGGIEAAVELGKALGREPATLVLYGVEPADVSDGNGLSPAVIAALPVLVDRVLQEVRSPCA